MHFSVIICTRDRAAALHNVLSSIARADRPDLDWELLVVDNGSTDNTPAVIESFAETLPIRRVYEPKAGLSNARNRGVSEAKGEFILWTDDDVLVRGRWLTAFAEAFQAHSEMAVFGGCILPLYAEPKAHWFIAAEDQLRSLLAHRNFSGLSAIRRLLRRSSNRTAGFSIRS